MTIKELKEIISDLDDNMKIGGSGHFGEYLDCHGVFVREVSDKRFGENREKYFV
jgi:hypothetical protein